MATAAELAILLKLHDEMSADLKKAEANVKSFGSTLDRVGKIATGVLVAAGIRTGLRDIVNLFESATAAAEEHARVESQVQAVLKSTGGAAGVTADQIFGYADALQKVTRFSDEQVASAEALLLTFTRIGKDIFPQVTETVLDMATALGEDTSSAAIQLGKALQDPILGVTALRRVGVAFTADQQKQIKALVESGHGMEAQRLILKELNTEFGGSAKALTESEKRFRSFNVAIDEGKEKLGAILTGGLIALGDWFDAHEDDIAAFVEKLRPAFDAFQEFAETRIGAVIDQVGVFLDAINSISDLVSDLAHGRWQSAWEDFLQVVTNFGKSLLNNLVAIFGTLPNIVIDAMNKAIDAINKLELPKEINTHLFGSVPIPGGGGGLNLPNIPKIPTTVFSLQDSLQTLEKLGEAANRANPPVRKVVDDFGEAADGANKLADALKKWQDEMGKSIQSLLQFSGISSAVSALFGKTSQEQADLKLAKLTEEARRTQFGQKSVHFGPGEGPGVNDPAKQQAKLDLIDKQNELAQAKIEQAKFHITEGQRADASAELLRVTVAQTTLIRDKLNPSITDLVPEIDAATSQVAIMTDYIDKGGSAVSTALLGFARRLNEYQLPVLDLGKKGSSGGFVDVQP